MDLYVQYVTPKLQLSENRRETPLLRRRLMRGRRTRRAQLLLDRLDRAQQQIRPAPLPLLHLRLTLARADGRRDDVPRHLLPTIAERASLPRARRLLNAGDV